jgi:glutamate-1-semialdehyde 2,1-aminomutase
MDHISPDGPVYQAGTLSGNPVAMAAGLKTLELISTKNFFNTLNNKTKLLVNGLTEKAKQAGIAFTTNQIGGMFGFFFSDDENIDSFDKVMKCKQKQFNTFFHGMLAEGVYLAPSSFEAGFVSSAHSEQDIETTINAAEKVFSNL